MCIYIFKEESFLHFDKLKARRIEGDGAWRSRNMCIRQSLIYFIIFIAYYEAYYQELCSFMKRT